MHYTEFNRKVEGLRITHNEAIAAMEKSIGAVPVMDGDSPPEVLDALAEEITTWCYEVYQGDHPRLAEYQETLAFLGIAYPEAMDYITQALGVPPMPSPLTPDEEVTAMIAAITGICQKVGR